MQITDQIVNFVKKKEGLELNAYRDPVGIWTIGYGNTFYENGAKVKPGDSISLARADQLFLTIFNQFAGDVRARITAPLNPNQFSALVSFAYNVGIGNLSKSTLLKKVNANPADPSIRAEFMKWNRAGGKILTGLTLRREAEANIYFTPPGQPIQKKSPVGQVSIFVTIAVAIAAAYIIYKA